MQIFKDNQFVTGIEYRDKSGEPRDGSIIIPDDSKEAVSIMDGWAFTYDPESKKITILEEKTERGQKLDTDKTAGEKIPEFVERIAELQKILGSGEATDQERDEAILAIMALGTYLYDRGMFVGMVQAPKEEGEPDPVVRVKLKSSIKK